MKVGSVVRDAIETTARHKSVLPRDPFGNVLLLKRALISIVGLATYPRYRLVNRMKVQGTEYLEDLPDTNVLFLSNHQTYFADVIALYHIFCAVKWGFRNNINNPVYLSAPRVKSYYVAAEETMKKGGLVPKLLSYAGAITIKRSWRAEGKEVDRGVDRSAVPRIEQALSDGWVVTFPQGTTSPYAPIRKGTAHMIRDQRPIVIPVVIDGFRRAFDKKGLFFKKRGVQLSVRFKEPLTFPPDMTVDEMVELIRLAIEQDRDMPFPWDSK